MKQSRVVADSSCLIALSQIKKFDLLKELFLEVYIPYAVYEEVVIKGKSDIGSDETKSAVKEGWLLKKVVIDKLAVNALKTILGKGESEVIVLTKELKADYAIIDERTARDMASLLSVKTIGVLGIISLAIERGFPIDKKKVIDQLKSFGFRMSDKLYKKICFDSD